MDNIGTLYIKGLLYFWKEVLESVWFVEYLKTFEIPCQLYRFRNGRTNTSNYSIEKADLEESRNSNRETDEDEDEARLLANRKKQKEKNVDILLADCAIDAQDWIVEEADVELGDTCERAGGTSKDGDLVRELHESDSESDDEVEVAVDFESDDDRILEEMM